MCNDSPKVYSGQLLLKKVICTKVFTHSHFHSESKYYIFQIFIQLREEKVFAFRTRKGQNWQWISSSKRGPLKQEKKLKTFLSLRVARYVCTLQSLGINCISSGGKGYIWARIQGKEERRVSSNRLAKIPSESLQLLLFVSVILESMPSNKLRVLGFPCLPAGKQINSIHGSSNMVILFHREIALLRELKHINVINLQRVW